jgi:hypothetical protein
MSGESNLNKLLKNISPVLTNGEFVYCTFKGSRYGDHHDLKPIAAIHETEGLTLVIPKVMADQRGLQYNSVFKRIELSVHSSLNAIGFTAAFSNKLAQYEIPANVFAGYLHDHIFVPCEYSEKAIEALNDLVQ